MCWIIQNKLSEKYPALLFHPKSEKIENLLRFQFIKGITEEYATQITERRMRYQLDADPIYVSEGDEDISEGIDIAMSLFVNTKVRPNIY